MLGPTACPSDETMAAYLDDQLSVEERARVEAHMADCDACVELLAAIVPDLPVPASSEVRPDPLPFPVPPAPVAPPPVRPRPLMRWMAPVAAGLVVVIGGAAALRQWRDAGPGLEVLRAAHVDVRPVHGRLTSFGHAPEPPTTRSGGPTMSDASLSLLDAAAAVEAARRERTDATSRHAYGVALLVAGDVDGAITVLTEAVAARPDDVAVLNDAATAWLQKAQTTSDVQARQQARRLAERATAADASRPEGWFNLAKVALLDGDDAAMQRALARLREIEGASAWVAELAVP
jgi:tetratricopeptide (TPR) repeat protein